MSAVPPVPRPARRRPGARPRRRAAGPRRQDARRHQGARPAGLRRQHSAPGFSAADSQGNWPGLDVDICRAVAAAVLGNGEKVKFVPLNAQQRFTALQSGEIDVLSRNTTWTLTRDASLGLVFTGVNYYDGQGFMVPKKLKIKSAKQLERRDRLRAVRHHHREEPDRLLRAPTA